MESMQSNILLIVVDSLRAHNVFTYGYPEQTTPFLDEFSEDVVQFENA